jgi:hypothetical protein
MIMTETDSRNADKDTLKPGMTLNSSTRIFRAAYNGHCWRTENGVVHAVVSFDSGHTYLNFASADTARQLAAACVMAAEAIEAQQLSTIVPTPDEIAMIKALREKAVINPGAAAVNTAEPNGSRPE